jgi:hypothetical protein
MKKLLLLPLFLFLAFANTIKAENAGPRSFSVSNDTDAYIALKLYPGDIPDYRDEHGSNVIKPHGWRNFYLTNKKGYSRAKSFVISTSMSKSGRKAGLPKALFDAYERGDEALADKIENKHYEYKVIRYNKSNKKKIVDNESYIVTAENGKFVVS